MRKISSASGPNQLLTKPRRNSPGSKETSGLPLEDSVSPIGSPQTNLGNQKITNDLQISMKHGSSHVLKNCLLMNEPYQCLRTYRLNSAASKRTFGAGLDTQASMNELFLTKDNESPTKEQIEGALNSERAKSGL
jgi:hypothetical protein